MAGEAGTTVWSSRLSRAAPLAFAALAGAYFHDAPVRAFCPASIRVVLVLVLVLRCSCYLEGRPRPSHQSAVQHVRSHSCTKKKAILVRILITPARPEPKQELAKALAQGVVEKGEPLHQRFLAPPSLAPCSRGRGSPVPPVHAPPASRDPAHKFRTRPHPSADGSDQRRHPLWARSHRAPPSAVRQEDRRPPWLAAPTR